MDEEAAQVVRRIFQMTMDGYGPYQIAKKLKEDQVEIPAVHMARHGAGLWQGRVDEIKDPYAWGSSTVAGILRKREYLGHTVNFKTRKHFKDKRAIMCQKITGQYLRTRRKRSLIRKPLIMSENPEECPQIPGRMGRSTSTDRADVLCRLRGKNVCAPGK